MWPYSVLCCCVTLLFRGEGGERLLGLTQQGTLMRGWAADTPKPAVIQPFLFVNFVNAHSEELGGKHVSQK